MVYGLESDFVEKLGSLDVQALAQESGEQQDVPANGDGVTSKQAATWLQESRG